MPNGLRGVIYGGLNIGQHAWRWQAFHRRFQGNAGGNVVWRVAHFHALLDAVKRGGRHSQVAFCGINFCHFADVGVNAKDFLQHHHGARRLANRFRHPGRESKAVSRCEFDKSCHERPFVYGSPDCGLRHALCNLIYPSLQDLNR